MKLPSQAKSGVVHSRLHGIVRINYFHLVSVKKQLFDSTQGGGGGGVAQTTPQINYCALPYVTGFAKTRLIAGVRTSRYSPFSSAK